MTLILLREDTSVKLLASMGVSKNVARAIDSGFCAGKRSQHRYSQNVPHSEKETTGWGHGPVWLSGKAQENYEKSVAKRWICSSRQPMLHVVFIPQVTATKGDDDRITSGRVHDLMQHTRGGHHSSTTSLIIITLRRSTISLIYYWAHDFTQ